ncbi:MAG: adenine phosphoribosyltransferase [Bacteroidales bacterium]
MITLAKMEEQNHIQKAISYLVEHTRSIPDYPKPGIIFRDLTTVFQDERGMKIVLDLMSDRLTDTSGKRIYDKLVGIEARGFILAGGLSGRLGGGVVMARKPGKLPYRKQRVDYTLEYGMDAMEMHEDSIKQGEKIVVIDDLLATGGTADAACKLVERLGGSVEKVLFLVELPELKGRRFLGRFAVDAIYDFSGH